MHRMSFFVVALFAIMVQPALAQKKGQSASVLVGTVEQATPIELQSTGAGKGALIGGTLGYASGSSKSKSRRNAVIGGATGAALSSSGKSPGMEYMVKIANGSTVAVVSDQVEIQVGDCVTVEQSGDKANIRRQDPAACRTSAATEADIQAEFVEEANECDIAKRAIVDASSQEELELATAKARILCN